MKLKQYTIFSLIVLGSLAFSSIDDAMAEEETYVGWDLVAPDIREKCQSLEKSFTPPQEKLDPKILETLKNCDAEELYYGFDEAPNYIKARQCALTKKEYGILLMLYANGKGTPRNLDIAMYYACKFGGAPAELEGRVKHLIELKNTKKPTKDFDICDDITSGYMMGQCTAIEARFKDVQWKKNLHSLSASWNPAERKAFEKLEQSFEAFLKERTGEIDISGTARASFIIGERMTQKEQFLKTLQDCTQGKIPPATSAQYQEADQQLNTLYGKVKNKKFFELSGITSAGIQATQRAWLKYRESWVAFGHLQCPQVSEESWKTLLTKERVKELQELEGLAE